MTVEEVTIYVELEEGSGIPVFAPVVAAFCGKRLFKILKQHRSDYDDLKFKEGEYVYCLTCKFENKAELSFVAYCTVPPEAVAYLTGRPLP